MGGNDAQAVGNASEWSPAELEGKAHWVLHGWRSVERVVTRISQDVPSGFIRTWCGLHQLDLAIKHNIDKFLPLEFIQQLTKS